MNVFRPLVLAALASSLPGCRPQASSPSTAPATAERATGAPVEAPEQAAPSAAAESATRQDAVPDGPPPEQVTAVLEAIDADNLKAIVDTLAGFGTRHTLSDTESDERGIGAARRWIKAELERYAEASQRAGERAMTVEFDRHGLTPDGPRITREVDIVNVMATLPGTMSESRDRLIYVIGHYDSRASDVMSPDVDAPGANDDASGVAVTMELARVLAQHRLESTVVFMATAGEEQGLYGAEFHAQAAKKAGKDIVAVLNNDIVGDPTAPSGKTHDQTVRVFSEGLPPDLDDRRLAAVRGLGATSDSSSRQLARYVDEIAAWQRTAVQPMLIFRRDRFLRGGDHTAFAEAGFPAVRFCEVAENYDRQHQDVRVEDGQQFGDLPEFVDPGYLADVTHLNAAVVAHLANAPSVPDRARIIVAALTNDTTLRWDPSPQPDVTGYEVLWRETTSPTWQGRKDVGDVTEATVERSKDNYFFAVRAYDRDGYRSPAAYPIPARE